MHIFSEDHFRYLQPKISGNTQASTVVPAKMAVESAAQVSIVLFKVLSFSSMLYHSRLAMYKTLGGIFLNSLTLRHYSVVFFNLSRLPPCHYQVLNRILTIMFTVLLVSSSLHD